MECVVRISVFNFTNTGTKIHLQFQQGPFRGRTPVSLLHVIHFLAAWFPGFLCAIPAEIMSNSVFSVISRFVEEYRSSTPNKLKMIDAYLLYILLTGVFQFLYCLLVGTFPFNSFLSGFISCVGSFILAGIYTYLIIYDKNQSYFVLVVILCTCQIDIFPNSIYNVSKGFLELKRKIIMLLVFFNCIFKILVYLMHVI